MTNLAENKYRSSYAHDILVCLRALGLYTKLDRDGSKVRVRVHLSRREQDRFLLVVPTRGERYRVTHGSHRLTPLDARLGAQLPHDVAKEFAGRIATTLAI
ncbi:hypothetical protein OOJ91_34230 [Micromonospora lupini]|uniref:hypothetical protein n=1 Tax=Micromonospora lupini TaxID=285679 RepID=UPI00225357D4|nr:hypothetical protein [Micromonospora lupini]MCX5070908.1 hypothetical protein [Micromonospora lupini]